jgi:hypothetical protein
MKKNLWNIITVLFFAFLIYLGYVQNNKTILIGGSILLGVALSRVLNAINQHHKKNRVDAFKRFFSFHSEQKR